MLEPVRKKPTTCFSHCNAPERPEKFRRTMESKFPPLEFSKLTCAWARREFPEGVIPLELTPNLNISPVVLSKIT